MLLEVRIRNLAVIKEMTAQFHRGVHVITGETGAGKSILLHALNLLSGARASRNMIRDGEKTLYVEGVFSYPENMEKELLEPYGIEPGDTITLSRSVQASGHSGARVQGQLVTVAELKAIGGRMLDVYGQKDRALLDLDRQIQLVDSFFTKEQKDVYTQYRKVYNERNRLRTFLSRYGTDPSARERELDILRYQIEEIAAFDPFSVDIETLDQEHRRLLHAEDLLQMAEQMHGLIEGWSDEHPGTLQLLASAESLAHKMEGLDSSISLSEPIISLSELLQELRSELTRLAEGYQNDPQRLEELDRRMGEWMRLQRKYGQSREEIIAFYENAVQEAEQLAEREKDLQQAQEEIDSCTQTLEHLAAQVTAFRTAIGKQLDKEIAAVLAGLRMPHAEFATRLLPTELGADGKEQVLFYIRTNAGQTMRPLHEIASGGELSRVMLAIRSLFSREFASGTVVFDEIDTGVSGRAAQSMAEFLYRLSDTMQIIAVTHLPQIASMGDAHSRITKETKQDETSSTLQLLSKEERTEEVARLISGSKQTESAYQQADQLLLSAADWKRGGMHEL
ncbi:MAG: DNA repair protein RecN [Bacillota bacterium]|jgi:DNA repair protein RecN (Recombination protein N)|nr:DNA repair protein RecN [Bacillota bacterium]